MIIFLSPDVSLEASKIPIEEPQKRKIINIWFYREREGDPGDNENWADYLKWNESAPIQVNEGIDWVVFIFTGGKPKVERNSSLHLS